MHDHDQTIKEAKQGRTQDVSIDSISTIQMKYEIRPYLRSAIAWDVRTGSIDPDEGIITFRASELISDVEDYVEGKVTEALKSNARK